MGAVTSVPVPSAPQLREVLGAFASGVVVITAHDDGPVGMTVQSFASLSLRPPLVVFCPARTSRTWPRIRLAGSFCANVLAEDQAPVAALMASGALDRFAALEWEPGIAGAPRIKGALAHIEATVEAVHAGGDHEIVVARVRRLARARADVGPLVFHGSRYARLSDEGPIAEL